MKKIVILLVILTLTVTGCNSVLPKTSAEANGNEVENSEVVIPSPTIIDKNDNDIPNVEDNINGQDITEDLEMTEKAEDENITEENTGVTEDIDKEQIIEEKEIVLKVFDSLIPVGLIKNSKYEKYQVFNNYLLILSRAANIREEATAESKIIGGVQHFEKINLIAEVKGQYLEKYDSDSWYKISWNVGEEIKIGYIFSKLGDTREFQFSKMYDDIRELKINVEGSLTAYISNYKNRNGSAPLINGKTVDEFGILRYQSAPAYYEADKESKFRYIADGILLNVLAETESFYKVSTYDFEGEYYIPKRYVEFNNSIEELKKVVVIDRKNQNEAVFEYQEGAWNIVSYIYATTGEKAKYKLPTDLGHYMAIQKRKKFLYLDDVSKEIAGYAPFATRFSGGAYIHGVPVDFVKETNVEVLEDGQEIEKTKLVDPGNIEYLFTIGTVPRSHKCVRNYTSHAEFLYNWVDVGSTTIIVIE